MWQPFTVLLGLLLFLSPQLAVKVSAERRALQVPPIRARFTRSSATGLGQGGIHGSIADIVDFFGMQPKSPANRSTADTIESDAGRLAEQDPALQGEHAHHHHSHLQAWNSSDTGLHSERDRWVHDAPHPPSHELKETLYNAAYHDGAQASTGMAIVTAGNRVTMARLLPKFLHGLKHSLDSDITNHAVIVGMNKGAKSLCDGLQARYSHHCVLSPSWPGHETETDVGDTWHIAAELHKLELILNALTFGYSVLYVEPDTAVFRNPMPHLLSLTADIALPDSICTATIDNKTLNEDKVLDQDAGLIFARAGPPAVRFMHDWISVHKHDIHRMGNATRHDQAVFNEVVGPQVLHDSTEDDAAVRLHALSQDRFPSWCSGPCGCLGRNPVEPLTWQHTDDAAGGVVEGALECPDEVMDQWLLVRFGCTKSTAEREAVMDISLAMLEDAAPIDTSITAGI